MSVTAPANPLELYRDDGPLARAIGAAGRPLARVPQIAVVAVAAAPMIALMAAKGENASHAATGACLAWLILLAGATSAAPPRDRLGWAVAPAIRALEYAGLLWISTQGGRNSAAAAFALICALSFRHYDLVYRRRHQGLVPPRWVANLAAGWDGRLVLGYILLVADALPAGFFVAAGLLATVFVAESIAGWRRFGRGHNGKQPATYEDEEDEGQ